MRLGRVALSRLLRRDDEPRAGRGRSPHETAAGRPRRVLVAHSGADDYGADRVVAESIIGLAEAGWEVTLVVPWRDGPLIRRLRRPGVTIETVPTPVLRSSGASPRGLARLAGDLVRGSVIAWRVLSRVAPDVVLVNTVVVPAWGLAARGRRLPVVWHNHESEAHLSPLLRRVLFAPLLLSTVVVSNSEHTRTTMAAAWRRLDRRTVVVPNPVAGPDEPDPLRGGPLEAVRLLFIGRLTSRKGVDLAIDTVSVLRERSVDATLDVVGGAAVGGEQFERELVDHARALDLDVRFHGHQTPVWPGLARADVLLVPSRLDESFGNVVVEAMLAQRPVVVTGRPGLVEATASAASTRVSRSDDPAALADAVASLTAVWSDVAGEVEQAARDAARRHAPERYRSQMVGVLEQATSRVRPPTR